jgi:hypothetical protein
MRCDPVGWTGAVGRALEGDGRRGVVGGSCSTTRARREQPAGLDRPYRRRRRRPARLILFSPPNLLDSARPCSSRPSAVRPNRLRSSCFARWTSYGSRLTRSLAARSRPPCSLDAPAGPLAHPASAPGRRAPPDPHADDQTPCDAFPAAALRAADVRRLSTWALSPAAQPSSAAADAAADAAVNEQEPGVPAEIKTVSPRKGAPPPLLSCAKAGTWLAFLKMLSSRF